MKTPRQINAERKAKGLPPLNFALFRAVIKKLEAAPEAYDQNAISRADNESPCGTVACIGGWADILSAPTPRAARRRARKADLHRAGRALGVTAGKDWTMHGEESRILFNNSAAHEEGSWPKRFARQLDIAATPQQKAAAAIRYLTHIIKTGRVTT